MLDETSTLTETPPSHNNIARFKTTHSDINVRVPPDNWLKKNQQLSWLHPPAVYLDPYLCNLPTGCTWELPGKHHVEGQASKLLVAEVICHLYSHWEGLKTAVFQQISCITGRMLGWQGCLLFKVSLEFLWVKQQNPKRSQMKSNQISHISSSIILENRNQGLHSLQIFTGLYETCAKIEWIQGKL
jgi:hypothetical protein